MSVDVVNDIEPRIQYVALAAQTDFDYPFPIFEDSDLVVDVDGTTQALTTDYTVTGAGADTGGTITFLAAMAGNEVVTIYRDIPIERLTDLQQNGPLASATFNDEFDRITMIEQQLAAAVKRCLRFSQVASVSSTDTELSPISNWQDKYVYINSSGIPEPAAAVATTTLTQSVIAGLLHPQSAAEAAAGVTPVNLQYDPSIATWVDRYATNSSPGTTDMAVALEAAIDVVAAGGNPNVTFLDTNYLIGSLVEPDAELFGLMYVGQGSQHTTITIGHSSGAGLRINRSGGGFRGLNVTSSAGRAAGAAGSNYGILIAPLDAANKSCAHYMMEDVIVQAQPSHGIVVSGPSTNATWRRVLASANNGHGIVADAGHITGRTNKGPPGQYTCEDIWSINNGGNGLVLGSTSDTAGVGYNYRWNITNLELAGNAADAGVRLSYHEAWIHGEEIVLDTPAFGGGTTHKGLKLMGRDCRIRSPRFISCTGSVTFDATPDALATDRVTIEDFRALNTAQNPAFEILDTTLVKDIRIDGATAGNVTSWFTAGAVRCTVNLTQPIQIVQKTADQTCNADQTLNDDTELQVALAASETVAFEAFIRYSGAASGATADIKFGFTAPAGATIRWAPDCSTYINTADTVTVSSTEQTESTELAFGGVDNATRHVRLTGRVVMGTTAGLFKLQWAQNTSTATDTKVLLGSQLRIYRGNVL